MKKLLNSADDIIVQHKEIFWNISEEVNHLYKELFLYRKHYIIDRKSNLNLQINKLNDNIDTYINAVWKWVENSTSRINDSFRIVWEQTGIE